VQGKILLESLHVLRFCLKTTMRAKDIIHVVVVVVIRMVRRLPGRSCNFPARLSVSHAFTRLLVVSAAKRRFTD